MERGSFPLRPPTLNTCLQIVIDVAHARRLRLDDTVLGNMVRVHLGQAVFMAAAPPPMPELLVTTPLEALIYLPGPGGNREQSARCVRLARQMLVLSSLGPEDQRHKTSDLVHAGTQAYKLAADTAASYDRWFGEMWWELGTGFHYYSQIVAAGHHMLEHEN